MRQSETPEPAKWQGLTLDELRYRRALSAVKLEAGKSQMTNLLDNTKNKVESGGMRGLLFKNSLVSKLKFADYLILSYQATRTLLKIWRKFK